MATDMHDDRAGCARGRAALVEDSRRTWERTTALVAAMQQIQDELYAGVATSRRLLQEGAAASTRERPAGSGTAPGTAPGPAPGTLPATVPGGSGPAGTRPAGLPGTLPPGAALPDGRLLLEMLRTPPGPAWGTPASASPVAALPRLLREVQVLLQSQLRALLDGFQLSGPQWRVLQAAAAAEADIVVLMEATDLPVTALVGVVAELERRGLLAGTPDDGPPRRVGLTRTGRDVHRAATADLARACGILEAELGAGEAARLHGLLALLAARLGGDAPPAAG